MKQSKVIIIVAAVIAVAILIIGAYTLLNSSFAPLDQKETKTLIDAAKLVEVQAFTFNGDIIIQPSTGTVIEIKYDTQAPQGHLNEITTVSTNDTVDGITKVFAEAKILSTEVPLVNHKATITIKLPADGQYNLTLNTLNGNIIKPQLNDTIVTATTVNGKIDIKDDNAIAINASSQNGNINIRLKQGTEFQVDAKTANGHVTSQDIAMHTNIQTTTHLNGVTSTGSGKLNLTLSAANGNITLEYYSN